MFAVIGVVVVGLFVVVVGIFVVVAGVDVVVVVIVDHRNQTLKFGQN